MPAEAPRTYWVFNQTRESFLSLGVRAADTSFSRLKGLIGKLRLRSDDGIWVVPSRGIHTIGVLFPIDVVYLDEDSRVIHLVEHFGRFRIAPIRRQAASVLELRTHTIHYSHTQVGDRLLICTQAEMGAHLRELDQERLIREAAAQEREGLRQWLFPPRDRREAIRRAAPDLIAFYWDGGNSTGHQVRDMSSAGLYLRTQDRWYPGTILRLALRKNRGEKPPASSDSLVVNAKAIRHDDEGVGFQFVGVKPADRRRIANFVRDNVGSNISGAVRRIRSVEGHAVIEYALLLPLLFLLIVNTVNFGGFLFAWITVSNAARAGAQYEVLGGASPTAPIPATPAQIVALVTNDVSSLLNRASLQVRVCTNNNGTVACSGTGSGTTPSDPEPASYVLTTVDVTYTYNPFIPLFSFSGLGIRATLPPTTIHRMAAMRAIQ